MADFHFEINVRINNATLRDSSTKSSDVPRDNTNHGNEVICLQLRTYAHNMTESYKRIFQSKGVYTLMFLSRDWAAFLGIEKKQYNNVTAIVNEILFAAIRKSIFLSTPSSSLGTSIKAASAFIDVPR